MREKYTTITVKILIWIPILFSLFFIDIWILPQKEFNDKITHYSKIVIRQRNKYNNRKEHVEYVGNKFFTQGGVEFSIHKAFIEENEVTIKRSYIFRDITSVKSKNKDYSKELVSGLNGACLYFLVSLTIVAIISLLLLLFNTNYLKMVFKILF